MTSRVGTDAAGGAASAVPLVHTGQASPAMRLLGERLTEASGTVLERTSERAHSSGRSVKPGVQARFEQISLASTRAVARWMEGAGVDAARQAAEQTWEAFAELAAQRDASLDDITLLGIFWRDATAEVLSEIAASVRGGAKELPTALRLLQMSVDFSQVQTCKAFEQQLQHREQELAFLATLDPLTGLPNRALIIDRVTQMLARSRRSGALVAALFIDLDGFKGINDTYGHQIGDELLRAVAARLEGATRAEDTLGRLGGDEFVVISDNVTLEAGPHLIAERLLEALTEPFELGETPTRITITASIGVAAGGTGTAEELLRDADIAMYQAKEAGRNRWTAFESGMEETLQRRVELKMELREALAKDEFVLAYQPTFSLDDMAPNGVEALIRWAHPTRGIVPPNEFIPLLEDSDLINDVGRWVLDRACAQGATWRAAGHSLSMAVNVSARQLDGDQLVADVKAALADSGLEPSALTLEITETAIMRNVAETARRLTALRQLGVRIAIDDFGTGYSSLAHLQQFPVNALKIDRSFINVLKSNPEGRTLIHTLVELGRAMSLETFAEGIEEDTQLELLREEACDSGQGFLFARPLDVEEVEELLRTQADPSAPQRNGRSAGGAKPRPGHARAARSKAARA